LLKCEKEIAQENVSEAGSLLFGPNFTRACKITIPNVKQAARNRVEFIPDMYLTICFVFVWVCNCSFCVHKYSALASGWFRLIQFSFGAVFQLKQSEPPSSKNQSTLADVAS
jgi:hypothetical protein